ncbi:hypothetical protein SAMN05421688_3300 [Poseidonocella pacifica]|uniref:Uncharacterized protein n=1 Tax=Poseidonocella pacifica TaxID=871651 RepID=A0A1I0YSB8_9RHOB|nr:hypothetical protein [Poseidonocella pacifica]SFB15887.1 hypothetical protein SAMN05421688_3300 [Poseidonocella pacifica]
MMVECYKVKVRVPGVVTGFVVDSQNETCFALCEFLGENERQCFPLSWRSFNREGDNESLTDSSTPLYSCALYRCGLFGIAAVFNPSPKDDAGR